MSTALDFISNNLSQNAASSSFPFGVGKSDASAFNLNPYINDLQFERIAHDIGMWREAIFEMEDPFYPARVKSNRMYMDTVENGYVKSVMERWLELSIQRDFEVYKIDSKGEKDVSKDLTQALLAQTWFADYIQFTAEAMPYGYSLISLGDIVNDGFPNVSSIRRENIRPDGLNKNGKPLLVNMVYSIDGISVQDHPLIDMCNHWMPTKSPRGVSNCGYGWLYNIALYEIHLRHILEWNMDFVEGYGQPIKVGSTNKTGNARKAFKNFLQYGGSNQWILLDKSAGDEMKYEFAQNAGTAWKTYDNVERRLEDKISQLVLGHTDAIRSTAGKLGGNQNSNKEGNNVSQVQQAMNSKQITAGNFITRKINEESAPKFRKLGKYVGSKIIKDLFPEGYMFGLKNDMEEEEIKRRTNQNRTQVSIWAKNLNDAGYDVSIPDIESSTGLTGIKAIDPRKVLYEERKNDTTIHKDPPEQVK